MAFDIPLFREPTEEELQASARRRYDAAAPFMINRWPQSVLAQSFPTRIIEVPADDIVALFDYESPDWKARATAMAELIDREMDWEPHFVRLGSRSPKDVSDNLVTCSGRQAVHWISQSERCIDDAWTAQRVGEPMHICLREARHLFKDDEFRCFAKDGKVLGVSRYFYRDEPEHRPEAGTMLAAASAFYDAHLKEHYADVVFDLHAPGTEHEVLIEINPYGLSDPCLFGDYEQVEAGGERLG